MIKSVNPINFKGTNLVTNVKEQQKQETSAPAAEQPQANGSEAMANYNKAAIHPSQQIKPQANVEEPKANAEKETQPAEVKEKENEKDDDKKEEKDD